MNISNPKTFNEKLQWLKLHDRKAEYSSMVDKFESKLYVANLIGEKYIIPTLGVWNNFEDIDFNMLPQKFVLKCTHDSGGVVICKDKENLNMMKTRKIICESLKRNYYFHGREWPYKNVKPRIIAEQYMGKEMIDYKLFCFNGEVKLVLVCSERFSQSGLKEDFYDKDWKKIDLKRPKCNNSQKKIKRPYNFELMKELAERMSVDIPFVRIDFYEVDKKVYFGEITFYPASGLEGFEPQEWDYILGSWIDITRVK